MSEKSWWGILAEGKMTKRRCTHQASDERKRDFNYRNGKEERRSRVGCATSVFAEEQIAIIWKNGYRVEKANKLSKSQ